MASPMKTSEVSLLPTSITTSPWTYDVFLSFRGDDTRTTFTESLHTALKQRKIEVFIDYELSRGEEIKPELLKAIEDSGISIIVFSKNYASSSWCLDELLKIMECRENMGQIVLPVFYDIDPSYIRKQSGSYADAFARHDNDKRFTEEKLKAWREALTNASNLAGFNLQNEDQEKFIQRIVENVLTRMSKKPLNVAVYPVGMDSRVKEIFSMLGTCSNDVRFVGICGMAGIGKTTIAKAVYNRLCQEFEGSSFLSNVGKKSEQINGLARLQENLLSDILIKENLSIRDTREGIDVIQKKLCNKKVLIVLDEVDQSSQLEALARKHEWFGEGSKIIITTRYKHLLNLVPVDETYSVKELDPHESLQLFSWHAFRKNCPEEGYLELSRDVVSYVRGLPLALKVFGSFLIDKRRTSEWISALEKLRNIRPDEIEQKLRISFDALDRENKEIFLDIAFFFIGMNKNYAIEILDGCGFSSEASISDLVYRSLITIDENDEIRMSFLLRDMGREIVLQEAPKDCGKRSRLWSHKDVCDILENKMGTENVEGLILENPETMEMKFVTEAFANMKRLRLLQLNNVDINGDYGLISRKLRWLRWNRFSLEFIPTNFHLDNLVALEMQYSKIKQVWKEEKLLKNLKILDLSHSADLVKTPDFLSLPNLERLILECCTSLVEVHHSIGHLHGLIVLNLKDCKSLQILPESICNVKSLKNLILSGCSSLKMLPDKLGSMESLMNLSLEETSIEQLPNSIVQLENLKTLSIKGIKEPPESLRKTPDSIGLLPASLSGLRSLKSLKIRNCNLLEGPPSEIGSLASLEYLDLCGSHFCSLPNTISQLSKLKNLWLGDCTRLEALPELPSNLDYLHTGGCTSLKEFSNLWSLSSLEGLDISQTSVCNLPSSIRGLSQLKELMLEDCKRLKSIPELPSSLERIYASGCTEMERLPNLSNLQKLSLLILTDCHKLAEIEDPQRKEPIQEIHMDRCKNSYTFMKSFLNLLQGAKDECSGFNAILAGSEVPDWFTCRTLGSEVSFEVPLVLGCKVRGLTLCAVYAGYDETCIFSIAHYAYIINITKGVHWLLMGSQIHGKNSCKNNMWVRHRAHPDMGKWLEGGDQVRVMVHATEAHKVKMCGVHLVYKPDDEKRSNVVIVEDERSMLGNSRAKNKRQRNQNGAGPSNILSDPALFNPHLFY
ncbi:PREDICTED: TMV resistance protein N-like [Nelumbo nucifera]|uniref:TIR domain-containing protein n=2 Tax=Nelumbo nucifera TaxID=4432 RepID=A0A822Z6J9_NELNU|nr:PREDICTED: TMV resistance protein N-like [Nelumbo nucifera]DAD39301.1 TPA_asm: hypothetical protein HUJ06_013624 [Nelumbo nucifera]